MKAFVLTLGLLGVSACGTFVSETQLNPAPRPLVPRGAEAVEIFSSTGPTRAHVDVALLEASQNDGSGTAVIVQRLREQAGAKGCDAVFIVGLGPAHSSETMQATCIVYTDGGGGSPQGANAPPVGRSPPAPPAPPPAAPAASDGRRTCVTREDFETHRNCVLPTVK